MTLLEVLLPCRPLEAGGLLGRFAESSTTMLSTSELPDDRRQWRLLLTVSFRSRELVLESSDHGLGEYFSS